MWKAVLFLTAATLGCVAAGVRDGPWRAAIWPALSFGWIGVAYAQHWPQAFGKRPNGTLPAGHVLFLFPFLVYQWAIWSVLRVLLREPACHELLPDLWIGRRLLPHEVPACIERVVDLTAEFAEPAGIRNGRDYICRPVLDATAPTPQALHEWVLELERQHGCLYIHCAQGHGRTGLLAAALLIHRGIATDAATALSRIQSVRPLVR